MLTVAVILFSPCSPVKQAKELHQKLAYVNQHQTCELEAMKKKLEACREELVESRAQIAGLESGSGRDCENDSGSWQAKQRATEQDLKMVRDAKCIFERIRDERPENFVCVPPPS